MKKSYSAAVTGLFCLFLGGIFGVSLLLPKVEFSPLENRYLQKLPTLTLESLQDGTFMEDAEDYAADHIAGRDFWVALKAWSERLSGKRENNGVYFAQDDTLINRVEEPDMDKLERDMGYVDALVGNVSVPVYFGLIPSAAAVWSDKLPAGAPTADEFSIIDQLYFSTGAETVDLADALLAHKDEAIYYRTDHHWTSLGAFYGANALLESMGMEPLDLSDFSKNTVSDQFYGTIFSSSGVRWVQPDSIDTYVPEQGIQVTSYFTGQPEEGSLYVDSYLDKKDKYSYFLGGRQPLCVIETELTDAPRVLLIRDSYADSLAPFLTQRFSEIHLIDPRDNLNSIQSYVADNDIDAVVVLYSFSDFASDGNLFLLGR
jgi:hypothetical protein